MHASKHIAFKICYFNTYFDTSILSSISRFSRSTICRLSASLTALLTLFDSSSLNSCSTFCASKLILVSLKEKQNEKQTKWYPKHTTAPNPAKKKQCQKYLFFFSHYKTVFSCVQKTVSLPLCLNVFLFAALHTHRNGYTGRHRTGF